MKKSTKDKVKLVLLGAGFMGQEHLEAAAALAHVEYVGIVDVNRARASDFGSRYALPVCDDVGAAARETGADAADICVPTPHHLPLIRECRQHGLHVLVEKPLALNLDEAREIYAMTEAGDFRVMVAQVLRFWPEYMYAKEVAEDGRFGNIRSMDCSRLSAPPAWNSWMMSPDVGGGAAIDLQIHDMDFILQLLGTPTSIRAKGRMEQGAINAVQNTLEYEEGVLVSSRASYLMPEMYPFRMCFRIDFDRATLEMDSWWPKGSRLKVYRESGDIRIPELADTNAYGGEIAYFCQSLLSREPFSRVPIGDALSALRMCLASARSCRENKSIDLNGNNE